MKKIVLLLLVAFLAINISYSQPRNSFTVAFDSLHKKLSVQYAFTDWKKINWSKLNSEFRPRIVDAETKNDSSAFIMAMKEYTFRIPDGHISFSTGFHINLDPRPSKKTNWAKLEKKLRDQQIGASYGFALIKLDDGRFVVKLVTAGSPADLAGIKYGAEILEVNDKPILDALNSISQLWGEQIPATKEYKQLIQCRLIGRAPFAAVIKIKFKNRGDVNSTTKSISAVFDNYKTFDLTSMLPIKSPELSSKILPSGFGYIEVTSCTPISIIFDFIKAFENLLSKNVKGIVIDLRINTGGQDAFAAAVSGFFYSDTTHYEYWSEYDPVTSSFQRSKEILYHINLKTMSTYFPTRYPKGSIFIEPPAKTFKGPIVVMCSPRQVSSGEGIAMALQKLPQCKVVSFYGSHGSFGVVTDIPLMAPQDSIEVGYPYGRSLDVYNKIQVDSDADMNGGVIPNVRPPLNDQTIDKMFLQGIDVELEHAVLELNKMLGLTSIQKDKFQIPLEYSLNQNYPNPFNPSTQIEFNIPLAGHVTLKVYDVLGREVATLVNENKPAGNHSSFFILSSSFPSGVYIYRLQSGKFVQTKKLVFIK